MFQLEQANQLLLIGAIAKELKNKYPKDNFAWVEILMLIYHYQDTREQFFLTAFSFAPVGERAHLSLEFKLPESQVITHPDGTTPYDAFSLIEHSVLLSV